jgi:hypothetical protein
MSVPDMETVERLASFYGGEYSCNRDKRRDSLYTVCLYGLKALLKENGLLDKDKVDSRYTVGTIHQRALFIQGLMDADGTVSPTGA